MNCLVGNIVGLDLTPFIIRL